MRKLMFKELDRALDSLIASCAMFIKDGIVCSLMFEGFYFYAFVTRDREGQRSYRQSVMRQIQYVIKRVSHSALPVKHRAGSLLDSCSMRIP